MSRRHRKQQIEADANAKRDADLRAWCDRNDLAPDGTPLPAAEIARRALARQLADAKQPPREPEGDLPFWRRSYSRDL